MAKRDPAFLFYPKDWLEGTAEMLPEEKGVYIDLLCYQHQRGSIPSDTSRLANMVGLPLDKFLVIWKLIGTKFHQVDNQVVDRLVNHKLLEVTTDRGNKAAINRVNGSFAACLRKLDLPKSEYNEIKKHFNFNDFVAIDPLILVEEITKWCTTWLTERRTKRSKSIEDGNEDGDANENTFNVFWDLYPRKVSKEDARKAWGVLMPDADLVEKIKIALEKQIKSPDWAKEKGKFIPYPSTWIRGKRWQDQSTEEKPQRFTDRVIF